MSLIVNILLISSTLPLTQQHRTGNDDHVVLATKLSSTGQEEKSSTKPETASHSEDVKATAQMFQLNTNEYYRQHNTSIYSGNFTPLNTSFGLDDDFVCASGQNAVGNLITMILYCIVCIVGLFGNTLVIYVVLRFSKMQTVTNIYILNLAIADECFLIGIPFLLYTMQIRSFPFGEYGCKAYMVSTSITQFTSSIFLLIMSADRYIAVCHPISSPRYRTPMVSKMVSGFAWLTSVLLMLPVILFANTVTIGEHTSCHIKWPEAQNTQLGTTFILYSLALGFATPLTFILGFYCLVIRKLHTVGPKHKSKEKKRSHRKVTKLVLTVITVYILCWLPYWISQVALITSSPGKCMSRLEITIFLLVGCLGYSNSAMNPILYAFLSDNFKKSFMKACTCAAQKDINAQLQMENSMFPRFSKSRTNENLLPPNKAKLRKSLLTKTAKQRTVMASSTATTATATTTCALSSVDQNYSVVPASAVLDSHHLAPQPPTSAQSSSYASANSNMLVLPANCSMTSDNSVLDNSSVYSNEALEKSPVLHTDL